MDAMCAARDAIMARTAGYDWYWIILYLLIIALFLFTAHQTYYKYILPRLNPNFVPNREFIKKNSDMELPFPFPGPSGPDKPSDNPDDPNFDPGQLAELMFFCVKWCPHCKKAEPEWNKLVKKFDGKKINKSTVFFKKIDCEDSEALADQYKIQGYPTIKLEKGDQIIEYNAKPNAETLEEFLRSQL